ncbi:MAG: helix-turn-helix domain-containing protein [Actinomycetota bacterium]|nr:helix-turn-helix domain-containing protein [Actinomycetota bacterium]
MPAASSARSSKHRPKDGEEDRESKLLAALAHPLRQQILHVFVGRVISPADVAQELGAKLGDVGYHVRVLRDAGALELVRTEQRRGAVKHYYRATARPMLSDEQWRRLPVGTRRQLFGHTLDELWRHVAQAGKHGGFDHPEAHVSWTPLELDEKGFAAMVSLLEQTLNKAMDIHTASLERQSRRSTPAPRIRTEMALLHFHRGADAASKSA